MTLENKGRRRGRHESDEHSRLHSTHLTANTLTVQQESIAVRINPKMLHVGSPGRKGVGVESVGAQTHYILINMSFVT